MKKERLTIKEIVIGIIAIIGLCVLAGIFEAILGAY